MPIGQPQSNTKTIGPGPSTRPWQVVVTHWRGGYCGGIHIPQPAADWLLLGLASDSIRASTIGLQPMRPCREQLALPALALLSLIVASPALAADRAARNRGDAPLLSLLEIRAKADKLRDQPEKAVSQIDREVKALLEQYPRAYAVLEVTNVTRSDHRDDPSYISGELFSSSRDSIGMILKFDSKIDSDGLVRALDEGDVLLLLGPLHHEEFAFNPPVTLPVPPSKVKRKRDGSIVRDKFGTIQIDMALIGKLEAQIQRQLILLERDLKEREKEFEKAHTRYLRAQRARRRRTATKLVKQLRTAQKLHTSSAEALETFLKRSGGAR